MDDPETIERPGLPRDESGASEFPVGELVVAEVDVLPADPDVMEARADAIEAIRRCQAYTKAHELE